MKFRKIMMTAGLAAAIASMSVFGAFAAEDDDIIENVAEDVSDDAESQSEWYSPDGSTWYYYVNGVPATNTWIDGGTRSGDHYWYYVGSDGVMYANTTRTIDGVAYSFDEDGTYVEYYTGAPTGTIAGNSFSNSYFNIKIENLSSTPEPRSEYDTADQYVNEAAYAVIGNPKTTQDLIVFLSDMDLEVYYLDVSAVPNMSASEYASAFANAVKGRRTYDGTVTTVTIAGQPYSKVSTIDTTKKHGKEHDYYFRKQGNYMVVIEVEGDRADADQMAALVNNFTTVN